MSENISLKLSVKSLSKEFLESDDQFAMMSLWITRLLNSSFTGFYTSTSYRDIDRQNFIELMNLEVLECKEDDKNVDLDDIQTKQMLSSVKSVLKTNYLKTLEKQVTGFNGALDYNLIQLKKHLGLNDVEIQLLAFFILGEINETFYEFLNVAGDFSYSKFIKVLSHALGVKDQDIAVVLDKSSTLNKSGILKVHHDNSRDEVLDFVSVLDGLSTLMTTKELTVEQILENFFAATSPALLTLKDYPHVEINDSTITYLKNSKGKKGINVLIYGQPGTGKTQWVKTIIQELKMDLYEINSEDSEGESIPGENRMELYKLAQYVLGKQDNAAIIFDEIEDVFPENLIITGHRRSGYGKAWFNKLLENNPTPAFWLTNSIRNIDRAYLRRFDLVVHLDTPPKSVRKNILTNLLKGINVRDEWIERLSKESVLVPAVMERAIKVASTIYDKTTPTCVVEQEIERLINNTLEVQGRKQISLKNFEYGLNYSIDYLNTDADLPRLVEGLKDRQVGRMCLYGLPGTGKTAFGHYLSDKLDKPLVLKKVSDLISPYLGVTEMNIAAAFREAGKEGAILQIDEADSFLQSRDNARHSWEITQVNEMLTQMECFDGIFIASTNLVNNLDQAAMRRFDLKLEFKPLTTEQSLAMFEDILLDSDISLKDKQKFKRMLTELNVLTPGDFAAVKRKFRLGFADLKPDNLLEALKEECSYKPNYNKAVEIGFHSSLGKNSA